MRSATAHDVLIPGIMEHIERAGVHSGDSFAVYPAAQSLGRREVAAIARYTSRHRAGARCARPDERPVRRDRAEWQAPATTSTCLEVNPRASRTVPFLSKVTGVPMVDLATQIHARPDAGAAWLSAACPTASGQSSRSSR